MTDIEDLAKRISDLAGRVESITRTSQIANTSLSQGGETTDISDTVLDAQDSAATIPGLQELLDANESALAANSAAVAEALIAATQASADGIAAGELASAAADVALDRAQEALDAAATAGGGATYTGRAPTATDPGVQGQQWFVWDSNYHVTAYYVYDGGTSAWVQTQITDAVLGNISAGVITSGYLSSARIATASLTAAVLAADTLTSREIGADAILARNIKAGQVTATAIAASTITGDKIAANTITAGNIAAGSITANEIAAGTITATQINLDTLNGKTITGALFRSAASGARIEIRSTAQSSYTSGDITWIDSAGNQTSIVPSGSGGIAIGSSDTLYTSIGNAVVRYIGRQLPVGQPNTMSTYVHASTRIMEVAQNLTTPVIFDPNTGFTLLDDGQWQDIAVADGYTADNTRKWRVRRIGQQVEVAGQVTRTATGSIAAGGTLGTLPAFCRPSMARDYMCPGVGSAWARVTVNPDGTIKVGAINGTATYLITDVIHFMVN